MLGLNFESDDGAGFVHGNEKGFANVKGVAGVKDGDGFGAGGDGAGEGFGVEDAGVGVETQVEVAENFQRVNPGFDVAGFVAEEAGLGAHGGEKFPGADGAGELEGGVLLGGAGLLRARRPLRKRRANEPYECEGSYGAEKADPSQRSPRGSGQAG